MRQIKLIILICILTTPAFAQNLMKTGVVSMKLRNTGAIIHDDQVKGYYFFYNQEKKDRKNNNYLLNVVDENLREINSINIIRPVTYTLIEGAYNGQAFGFMFYDKKTKAIELISYDETLKQLGTHARKIKSRTTLAAYNQIALGNEPTQAYLLPIKGKGFLIYGVAEENENHFQIDFFDNTMKKVWTDRSSSNAKVELAMEAFQNEQYVGSLIGKKKTSTSKDIEFDLLIHNTLNGSKLFRVPAVTKEHTVSISNVYYDSAMQNFVVFGEYYKAADKELKDQSLGFITMVYDMQGNCIKQKTNSWAEDISKVTPLNEKGKFVGNNASVLFHNAIRTQDGQIFLIGEQYKKVVSGAGVALQALNILSAVALGGYSTSTPATSQLNVYSMVIFQFNPDYSINRVHIFEKNKNEVLLPAGSTYSSAKILSYYAKAIGGFDYSFTQVSRDKNTFAVNFTDFNRAKGDAKNVFNSIIYTPEKTFVTDQIALTRKSTDYFVFKAKEGYVLVTEYYKKEKKVESRLEKINF